MSSSFKILVAGMVAVALGVATLQANDEKPAKEKPKAVKQKEKPVKEQPSQEKPAAVKKDGEKPTKQPPAKEKPEMAKKQPEKPIKAKPAPEKNPAQEKQPAKPIEKKPQAKTEIKGTLVEAVVKNVNADKQAITVVLLKDGEKVEQHFAVEKDARLLVGGNKAASLSDVKPDMRVSLVLTGQKTVSGIRSDEGSRQGEVANGIVKAVDEARHSITITLNKEGEQADQTFAVAANAKIALAGSDGKISDLKPGTRIAFLVAAEKKAILAIKAVEKGQKAPVKKDGSPKK